MSSSIDNMTEDERRAFRAYVVPDPVCIKSHGGEDSPEAREVLESLEENDTFLIRGAGRLENSDFKGTRQWKSLEHAKRFNVAITDIPVLNSRSGPGNEILRYIVSDILLQLQACIDQGKQEYFQQKIVTGIRLAQEKGTKVGRKPMERPPEFAGLKEEWSRGKISARQAAKEMGIAHLTFLRWAREDGGR